MSIAAKPQSAKQKSANGCQSSVKAEKRAGALAKPNRRPRKRHESSRKKYLRVKRKVKRVLGTADVGLATQQTITRMVFCFSRVSEWLRCPSFMLGLAGCFAKPLRGAAWVNFVNRLWSPDQCEHISERLGETLEVFLTACVPYSWRRSDITRNYGFHERASKWQYHTVSIRFWLNYDSISKCHQVLFESDGYLAVPSASEQSFEEALAAMPWRWGRSPVLLLFQSENQINMFFFFFNFYFSFWLL